jgi:hypothetical protein
MTDLGPDEMITVRVIGLPVDVQVEAQQHADELTREMVLVAEQMRQDGDAAGLPVRFVELVSTLSSRYSVFTAEQEQQLAAAVAAGDRTIDVTYSVPVSAAAAAADLGGIMDEVDDYCRQGRLLLTLATPALLVDYRRWFLDQFVAQAAGREPVSWADWPVVSTGQAQQPGVSSGA